RAPPLICRGSRPRIVNTTVPRKPRSVSEGGLDRPPRAPHRSKQQQDPTCLRYSKIQLHSNKITEIYLYCLPLDLRKSCAATPRRRLPCPWEPMTMTGFTEPGWPMF